jgi:hypothetical protein
MVATVNPDPSTAVCSSSMASARVRAMATSTP